MMPISWVWICWHLLHLLRIVGVVNVDIPFVCTLGIFDSSVANRRDEKPFYTVYNGLPHHRMGIAPQCYCIFHTHILFPSTIHISEYVVQMLQTIYSKTQLLCHFPHQSSPPYYTYLWIALDDAEYWPHFQVVSHWSRFGIRSNTVAYHLNWFATFLLGSNFVHI